MENNSRASAFNILRESATAQHEHYYVPRR